MLLDSSGRLGLLDLRHGRHERVRARASVGAEGVLVCGQRTTRGDRSGRAWRPWRARTEEGSRTWAVPLMVFWTRSVNVGWAAGIVLSLSAVSVMGSIS
jgi:hypothetical protein